MQTQSNIQDGQQREQRQLLPSVGGPTISSQIYCLLYRFFLRLARYKAGTIFRLSIIPGLFLAYPLYKIMTMDTKVYETTPSPEFVYVLSFTLLWPTVDFINALVRDKATQFKSLMFMMDMRRSSYELTSFLTYAIQTIHILVLYLICCNSITFEGTSKLVTLCVFILSWLQLYAFTRFIGSLITSTRYTSVMLLLFASDIALYYGVQKGAEALKLSPYARLFVFATSFSPFQSLINFFNAWVPDGGEQKFFIGDGGVIHETNSMILTTIICWTIIMMSLGLWLEEICPWKNDTEIKKPLFCFDAWTGSKNKGITKLEDECMTGSKYFQLCPHDKTTGLRIIGLSKQFNSVPAVKKVTLRIFHGETTLLLGHNGAGKTTLMNMILGQLTPDEGYVERVASDRGVGVCPQASIVDQDMTIYQHLKLFSYVKASDWSSVDREHHIDQILEEIGLQMHAHKYPSELSGGMLRKLSLGMALVGGSKILILDEPSSGLDPDSRMFIWNAIRRSRTDRTVLLSSQHMEEADYLGDRIAIMSEGQIVCCGSSIFLKHLFGTGYKLRMECIASEQHQAIKIIRRFFPEARISEDDQIMSDLDKTKIISSVIALSPDEREQSNTRRLDDEKKLIELLEYLEQNKGNTPIKSHGPRSSTIEDVLLNTNRFFKQDSSRGSAHVQIDTIDRFIDQILTAPRKTLDSQQEVFHNQLYLLVALMKKNFRQYLHDWQFMISYRILAPILGIYVAIANLDSGYPTTLGTFNYLSIIPRYALTIPVSSLITYPTRERCSKFKSMVQTTDANYLIYWLAHLITDMMTLSPIVIIGLNIFLITSVDIEPSGSRFQIHLIMSLAGFLYTLSGALMVYFLSFIFESEDSVTTKSLTFLSNGVIIRCTLLFIGFIINIPNLGQVSKNDTSLDKAGEIMDKILVSMYPHESLAYVLYGLRSQGYFPKTGDKFPDIFSPISHGLISMFGQIILYSLIIVLIEYMNADPSRYFSFKHYYHQLKSLLYSRRNNSHHRLSQLSDNEVIEESIMALRFINSGLYDHHQHNQYQGDTHDETPLSLVAGDLCKSYLPGVPVIDHLSFTVKRAECFGLLGVNGAGKSTTFSMLVADLKPDSGIIWLNGQLNTSNLIKYRSQIAYDPQSTPNISLTCTEALTLMSRLRRTHEEAIPGVVNALLEVFEMSQHASKTVQKLSGGTKRKLSLAMSLIGNPAFLALDEPTAGVDPIARRKVWTLLRTLRIKLGCSIIISSHAMEECEAICDRISIMARGRLRCLGTFMQLQAKHAMGCIVRISMTNDQDSEPSSTTNMQTIVNDIKNGLEITFRSPVKLDDINENSAVLLIGCDLERSKLFKIMRSFAEKYKQILYIISDMSLENVFKKIANESFQDQTELIA